MVRAALRCEKIGLRYRQDKNKWKALRYMEVIFSFILFLRLKETVSLEDIKRFSETDAFGKNQLPDVNQLLSRPSVNNVLRF